MSKLAFFLLLIGIATGQLIKLSVSDQAGPILLDVSVTLAVILGLISVKFNIFKASLTIKAALLFILIATVSLAFSPLHLSSQEQVISGAYILRFSLYIILGYLISNNFFKTPSQLPNVFIYSGLILSLIGFFQFVFFPDLGFLESNGWDPHYLRTVSTFLDPSFLGTFLSLSTLALYSQKTNLSPKKFRIFFVLIFGCLLLTFSRSAYLMFAAAFFSLSGLIRSLKLAKLTTLLTLILITSFALYTIFIANPRNINRERSASYRFGTWTLGFQIFQRYPILGTGYNTYRFALERFHLLPATAIQSRGASSNDSSILFVAATTGLIGLAVYLVFYITLIRSTGQTEKKDYFTLAGLIGLFIASIFNNALFYPPILLWLISAPALSKASGIVPKK